MILARSAVEAEPSKVRVVTGDGLESAVVIYFNLGVADHPGVGTLFPVAFRVEQDPRTQAEPHFHEANQFQVFIDGGGLLGKREVRSVAVQYTDAYTPYGPILAGESGISYLTLRNGFDPGASFMPAAREKLKGFGRRPRAIMADAVDVRPAPVDGATPEFEPILPGDDKGLGAWRLRLSPGATFTAPPPSDGGGQYWVVLDGEECSTGATLTRRSCVFLSPDEAPRDVVAGPAGLDALVLQFPRFA